MVDFLIGVTVMLLSQPEAARDTIHLHSCSRQLWVIQMTHRPHAHVMLLIDMLVSSSN
jgi:hypothetical protein